MKIYLKSVSNANILAETVKILLVNVLHVLVDKIESVILIVAVKMDFLIMVQIVSLVILNVKDVQDQSKIV